VQLTVPPSGRVLVTVTSNIDVSTSSVAGAMSFAVTGGDTRASGNDHALILTPAGSQVQAASASYVVSGLTPGALDTFTAQYAAPGPVNAVASFSNRQIWAIPLP
jgi:hypothetical protein